MFWPFGVRVRSGVVDSGDADPAGEPPGQGRFNGFWQWTGGVIIRWPGPILLASVVLLSPLAYQGLSVRQTYNFLNELEKSCPSVVGAEMAQRHFAPGEMSPVTVLALKEGAHFDTPDGEREIGRLTKALYDVAGVQSVRGLAAQPETSRAISNPFARKD